MKTPFLLFCLFLFSACTRSEKIKPSSKKPVILVSLAPYKKMIEQIAENKVTCNLIVPAGVDPHHFEPTLKKMHSLLDANLWFSISEEFESKIYPVLKQKNPDLQVVNLLDIFSSLDRLELSVSISETPLYYTQSHNHHDHKHDHGHDHSLDQLHLHANDIDTHIWLSPRLIVAQVQLITHFLKEILPKEADLFDENATKLIKQISSVQEDIKKQLTPFKNTAFLTNHEAFGYFCRDFAIEQIPVIASDFKELGAQDLSKIFEKLKKIKIRAAILQPEHPKKALTMIASQNNYPLIVLDPYAENYIKTMQLLTEAIVTG